jgi:hypothetical protein
VNAEILIILSNFGVMIATTLLFWASMLEQHDTIKAILRSNSSTVRRITALIVGRRNDSD